MTYRLFVDQYIPSSLTTVAFNHTVAEKLLAFARSVQMPHLILSGFEGSGRKTFANLYVRAKYGDSVHVRQQIISIASATKTIDLQMLYSDYHYQIDPSVHGVYDRIIIQGFIKDILQVRPICQIPYHLIILNNADKMTHEAQQSLRRTLEKNASTCRFIFLLDQESRLIESLMSRCVQLRLSAPTTNEIEQILTQICQKEQITCPYLHQIAVESDRNLTNAIHRLQQFSLIRTILPINIVDVNLDQLSGQLLCAKTPSDLQDLRLILYDLLVQCVEPIKLLKSLFRRIFITFPPHKQHQLIQLLVKYENTLKQGSKPIYHLEGFCLGVMQLR